MRDEKIEKYVVRLMCRWEQRKDESESREAYIYRIAQDEILIALTSDLVIDTMRKRRIVSPTFDEFVGIPEGKEKERFLLKDMIARGIEKAKE